MGLAVALVGDGGANAVTVAQAGKTTVENNVLSEAADYLETGKKAADRYRDAQNQLKDAVDEFRAKNCVGLDAGACRAKMESHRDELFKGFGKATLDFVPVIGTIKTFAEAALDYLFAVATIIPGERIASGLLKAAEKTLAKGDVAEASRLINKASDEVQTVKSLDVSSYKELKAREVIGDNLEHDHIPSFSIIYYIQAMAFFISQQIIMRLRLQ